MVNVGKSKRGSFSTGTTAKRARVAAKAPKGAQGVFTLSKRVLVPKLAFPMQLQNQVTYVDTVSRSNTAGAFTNWQFSANGLYDPDITGTGGQPLYFDQLMAVYNHYTVISSFIQVTVTNSAGVGARVGLYIDDDTSVVSTMDSLWQRPGAKMDAGNLASSKNAKLTAGWNAKTVFSGDPLGNSALQGNVGANPTEQSLFVLGFDDPTGTDSTNLISVKVTYNVVWSELKTIAES